MAFGASVFWGKRHCHPCTSVVSAMSLHIVFFVFPGFALLDLSGPLCAFELANYDSSGAYRLTVVSETGGPVVSSCGVTILSEPFGHDACAHEACDTLIVSGGPPHLMRGASEKTLALLRTGAAQARRAASVCTGAFLLAEAGLLDGKRATTHWRCAAQLQALRPAIRVDADRIFIQDGKIWTSAGVTAGVDLALALIENDFDADVSRSVARNMVVYHRRQGGQSQFSALLDLDPPTDRIRQALTFARERLHEDLPVERLAEAARLSPRQFARVFFADTGQTPARAIDRLRAEAARSRVEDGLEPLEAIARAVGFGDPERMRQSFIRHFGQPPQALRRAGREWRKTRD
jgi:transcriptional regulator GlxA family with amidase domain